MLYVFGSTMLLIPAVFLVGEYGTLGWVLSLLLLSGIILGISYRGYRRMLNSILSDSRQVTAEDDPELSEVIDFIEKESRARDITPPKLYVHPAQETNAMAIGHQRNGHIILFEGLMTTLETQDELKAVVGHELAHIEHYDSIVMSLLAGTKDTIVRFWTWVGFTLRKGMYERRGGVLGPREEDILLQKMRKRSQRICSPLGFFQNSVSRHREYIADADGAKATSPSAMIGALKSIDSANHDPTALDIPQSLCIHGTDDRFLSRLRADHPPIEKRIRNIKKIHSVSDTA